MFGEIFKDMKRERQYVILQKERIWDWKQEACPGFHAAYTEVLILRRITGLLEKCVCVAPSGIRSPLNHELYSGVRLDICLRQNYKSPIHG